MISRHFPERRVALAIPMALALLMGCSKVPQQDVDAARQGLENARLAEAADYAPEAWRQAEDAVAQMDNELQLQEKRFALTRSYGRSKDLAASAQVAANNAVDEAAKGKEVARTASETLLGEARTALEQAKSQLASAPAGKGTQVDIQALQADLAAVEQSLTEADRAFQDGRFHEAQVKAEAAKTQATQIQTEVESARSAKSRTY